MKITLGFKPTPAIYDDGDAWGILYPPGKDGVIRKQVTDILYCRDEIVADVTSGLLYDLNCGTKESLLGRNGACYIILTISLTERGKTPAERMHSRIEGSCKLLKDFESKAGWRKSRIVLGPCKYTRFGGSVLAWVIAVNSKWLVSPYTLSMMLLILRSGIYYTGKTIKNFANGGRWQTHKFETEVSAISCHKPYDLQKTITSSAQYWVPILKNLEKIFKGYKRSRLKYWKKVMYGSGIGMLLSQRTGDEGLNERIRKIKPVTKRTKTARKHR